MSFCCVFVLLPWILLCLRWWSLTLLSLSPFTWRGTSALIASSLSVSLFSDFRQHKSSILLCEPQIENLICISPFAFITTVCGLLSSNDIYNLYYFIIYIFYICCFFFCMMCFLSFYFWKSLVFGKLGSLAWVHSSTLGPLVPHPWASLVSLLIFHSGLQGRFSDTYFLPGQQSMSCFHPSHFPLLQSSSHFPAGLFLLCQTQGIHGSPADDIPCLCWSSCEVFPVLFTLGHMSSSQGQGYRILGALQSKMFPI